MSTAPVPERTLVVGVDTGRADWPMVESLDELERLVETAGGVVVARETQKLDSPIPKTFVGSGKAKELAELVRRMDIDVVAFDDQLSPSQQANLERIFGDTVKVIDRTALILDIFGRHATTREGSLQVQLAQRQYVLPRLRGMWSHLMGEQTRGGIGSRFGQGESQLEVDRRLVRDRIAALRRELARLETRRNTQSKARWDSGIYRVALAGYTNAGKSTLLKVVSRILKPASGTVKVSGTVAALIELGAGIDPQLTARENIFLNGTLLGYSKAFIESKFDDIVEFSELQDFLDSPVKNFSSGMKTRLAFSIATAVEPDILIADEILAVGDMRFKKKCAAKRTAMLEDGTTLLYVSHNIAAVKKQCNKAMWLDHGNVVMVGDADTVCDAFKAEMDAPAPAKAQSKDKK